MKYIEKVVDVSADALAAINRSGGSAMSSSTTDYSISNLYDIVKQYDKDFRPEKEVNPALLEDSENGNFVVTNKNKAEELLAPIGLQPSERSSVLSLAKSTLSQVDTEVKENPDSKDVSYYFSVTRDNNSVVDLSYTVLAEQPIILSDGLKAVLIKRKE